MSAITRRTFMQHSAGAVAAGLGVPAVTASASASVPALKPQIPLAELQASTQVVLGNTGIQCSALGMGTGVRSWNGESALTRKGKRAFYSLLEHAYNQGITYFDLADMYGSHAYMRDMLRGPIERGKVMLLTKSVSRDPRGMKEDIERFRRELDTDMLDVVLMHCLTKPGWTTDLQPTMEVLSEAKAKGHIRAHGVSCHDYQCMVEASTEPWVDIMLSRINPFGVKMDGTPEEVAAVLATAKANGKGMLGMKIVGEGAKPGQIPQSLKFVFGLGSIDAVTIGFLEPAQVDDLVAKFAALA